MEIKKGIVFTTDMIIGLGLAIIIILLFISFEFESIVPEKKYEKLSYFSEDVANLLSYLEVKGVKDKPTVKRLLDEGVIKEDDLNKTVLDLIGSFWFAGNETIAENISREVLENLTKYVCVNITTDSETIYSSCNTTSENVAVRSKITSGYQSGKPVYGYMARAFLTNIKTKTTSAYAYFGGYVGDGNLTKILNLPSFEEIVEARMELDVGNNFSVYINGNFSGSYIKGSAGGGNLRADKWIICNTTFNPTYCSFFKSGNNTIEIIFGEIEDNYIGGGYFKVTYNTSQMVSEFEENTSWLPGIKGFINLYSSFYIPGDLNALDIHLHYRNNYTTYLTIGNTEVYKSNETEEQIVDITNVTLSSLLDYQNLSRKTIPIRFGTEAFVTEIGGNADVVLITDVSGSMDWRLDTNEVRGVDRNCDNPSLYNGSTKRISLAKCLDKEFVDIILNTSGNRVALVAYRENVENNHDLSTNRTSLYQQIDSYEAEGGTCICCGINKAYEMLETQSNASRQKFVVVMTDGIPSHKCANVGCEGTLTQGKFEWDCYGWGCCCPANPVTGAGCDTTSGSCRWWGCNFCRCICEMQNANWSSCRVHNDLNATVNSIGFGPVADCPMGNWTLQAIAECGNGSYYASTNATELEEIYREIAEKIVNISFTAQKIVVIGNATMDNILYPDSYIQFNYTPIVIPYEYGEISLARETERLKAFTGDDIDIPDKEGWFNVSEKVKVVDAKITSYSSEFWTDRLYIKNSTGEWNRVYWLEDYSSDYNNLGDPFIVQIPVDYIGVGNNSVRIGTGINPSMASGGSPDDRVIYTIRLKGSVGYGGVFNSSDAAVDDAKQRLIQKVSEYVDFDRDDVNIDIKLIAGIQWLWGPSLFKVVVWER